MHYVNTALNWIQGLWNICGVILAVIFLPGLGKAFRQRKEK